MNDSIYKKKKIDLNLITNRTVNWKNQSTKEDPYFKENCSNGLNFHNGEFTEPSCLWSPKLTNKSNIDLFREYVNNKHSLSIKSYNELYKWSVTDYSSFWGSWWEWAGFVASSQPKEIVDPSINIGKFPKWFTGATLNYAENLLRFRDDKIALYSTGEGQKTTKTLTYKELYERTCQYGRALRKAGIEKGDRVVGYLPNGAVAVEGMLGTGAIGAIWSATSPDFGVMGVLDRFSQITPSVIISVEAVIYNGKIHDHLSKLKQVVAKLPSVKKVIIAPFVYEKEEIDISDIPNCVFLEDFLAGNENFSNEFEFTQVPFSHPQVIMFSSGTTGPPKCIVHSVGGTLVQITKEHILHCDLKRSDVMMYYTTTGWMMWNWLVSGLFTGCSLVLYDGSPLIPSPSTLWDVVDKLGVTVLGTGAKWLAVLEAKGVKPRETHNLSQLRIIVSTGSPLSPSSYRYVYRDVKKDVILGSVSGGTDIISCFMGCNPTLPVYEGEIQCRWLGMAIEACDEEGNIIYDDRGELICTKPFPSMPTHFWNDEGKIKYTKAYFAKRPNVWTHGDYCIISSKTGGIIMLGRSDGTLNPNGVRFGSAELYNIVEQFAEACDCICVPQRNNDGEERVIMFLKMNPDFDLCPKFQKKLESKIRVELSARHVPAVILPIKDIPYTVSGKKVEVAVRQVIHKEEVLNKGSLINPESLDLYKNLPQLQNW